MGNHRTKWLGGLAVTALMMALLPHPVSADPDSSVHNFTADCAYIKQLQDDPIKHPGDPGASHWHDFYANDRTDANSTVSSLENATVSLTTVSMVADQATFYLAPGVSHKFTPDQQVRVEGVRVSNQLNRVWTVSRVPTPNLSRFVATSSGISGLAAGASGTAGDAALSCGDPHGMLTYDTAAYWVPSAYLLSGEHITQYLSLRVYYFAPDLPSGPGGDPIPDGLKVIGGNMDAADPSENPHLQWSCGRREGGEFAFDTPKVDHPYDCGPFEPIGHGVIDGPVALLDMPYCWNGSGTDYLNTVYPNADRGQDDEYCDGDYTHAVIALEVRLHMGAEWGGTKDPCGGCLAYNLSALHEDCSSVLAPAPHRCRHPRPVPGRGSRGREVSR